MDGSSAAPLQAVLAKAATVRLVPFEQGKIPLCFNEEGQDAPAPQGVMSPVSLRSWSLVANALCEPAPSLQVLEIHVPEYFDFWMSFPYVPLRVSDSILAGDPALLRRCHLNGVTLSNSPAFSLLTTFDYERRPEIISMTDIINILAWMPRLKTLGMVFRFREEVYETAELEAPSAMHRCLTRVALAIPPLPPASPHGSISRLVAFFNARCCRADVAITVDVRIDSDVPHFGIPVHILPVQVEHPQDVFAGHKVTIIREANVMLIASQPFTSYASVTSATLSNLVCLAISESMWPDIVPLSAPRLKRLGIILQACTYLDLDLAESANICVSAALLPAWDCPALEKLHIAHEPVSGRGFPGGMCVYRASDEGARAGFSCACANGGILSLGDVCHFVRAGLRFSAPRLRGLALSGLRATAGDPDPVAAYLALQDLAEKVVVDECVCRELVEVHALCEQRLKRRSYYWGPSRVFEPSCAATGTAYDFFDCVGT